MCALIFVASVSPLFAAPAAKAAPAAQVLTPAQSRAQVLSYLQDKTGAPLQAPQLAATQSPLGWWEEQRAAVAKEPKARLALNGQTLLLSQALLEQSEERARKQGFVLACQSADFVAGNLSTEKWLLARIYQGFVLPHLTLGNVSVRSYPSRQRVLEAAIASFGNASETDTQQRVLEWMISSATKTDATIAVDDNALDWARGTLAALLVQPTNAPTPDLRRALSLLQSIQPRNAALFAYLRAPLEKRLDALTAAKSLSE